jgi:hypothetical protein
MNRLHKRNMRRKIVRTILVLGLVVSIVYSLVRQLVHSNDLQKNKILTTGVVTGTNSGQRNTGGGVDYVINVGRKIYKGSTAYQNLSKSFCEDLIGRSFPVIYSSKNVHNSEMLITKESFEFYDLKQPDSMSWIEKYVR